MRGKLLVDQCGLSSKTELAYTSPYQWEVEFVFTRRIWTPTLLRAQRCIIMSDSTTASVCVRGTNPVFDLKDTQEARGGNDSQ